MKKFLILALAVAVLSVAGIASAQTATANLAVSASVTASCNISVPALAFGVYDTIGGTQKDAQTTITATCTQGTGSTIDMNNGLNYSGERRMAGPGSSFLQYFIYKDASRTQKWETGAQGLNIGPAPNTTARTFQVYGRIPGGQAVPAGSFSDQVVVTLNFRTPEVEVVP